LRYCASGWFYYRKKSTVWCLGRDVQSHKMATK